ncbi:hypothetical protein AgCh_028710 [Apium graveolens]
MVDKEKKDHSLEDLSSIMKDEKVRHMSNRVIGYKTAKEIWDTLEVKCQGTTAIKKNRRTILTQKFQKLMNDLSLFDKEYDLEDFNLKFLLGLPEK